ncbi:MAG: S-layer family protein [Leptolyngbyaceae cyanobacterium RM1_405_57]|nr:S-layer family protein [Leptolyngbyaceae cyanobacterium RM1_405_57]
MEGGSLFQSGVVEVIGSDGDGNVSLIAAQVESGATGDAQTLRIDAQRLVVQDGGQIGVSTFGAGNAGDLTVQADEIELIGVNSVIGVPSGLFASVEPNATGTGGDIRISGASRLLVEGGAALGASTFGEGDAGTLSIAAEVVEVRGSDEEGFPSLIDAQVNSGATGNAQTLTIDAQQLIVQDGALISVQTLGAGNAGDLRINASDIQLAGEDSRILAATATDSRAGTIQIQPTTGSQQVAITFQDGARISAETSSSQQGGSLRVTAPESITISGDGILSARSTGSGSAGNLRLETGGELQITDSDITTSTTAGAAGGAIDITAATVELRGDGDIRTNVSSGAGGGGNITVTADSVLAFDDSDILAFADDGRGGDVTLNTSAFFGENYQPAPEGTDPDTLDGNDRVDINASGAVAGVISVPDLSFIQNSLSELPQVPIDPDELLANSCIARSDQRGSFTVTGAGGLPSRPGTAMPSPFPTGSVQPIPGESEIDASNESDDEYRWQPGEPIVEPQGVYQLPNGRLVMSRECA